MACCLKSVSNAKLPRWLAVTAGAAGVLILGIGMSRFLRFSAMREALLPSVVGSMLIYISGFEKRLHMDDVGVYQMQSFWGRKKEKSIAWRDIEDARIILNKGKYIYVLLHGADKIPPFILTRSKTDEVLELIGGKLAEERIKVER